MRGNDQRLSTQIMLLCGAIGPSLFVVAFLAEGATRPGYDAWRTTISTLSWGDQGWMQIANFEQFGVCLLGFALGLRRVMKTGPGSILAPILLAVSGLGLLVAGCFATDPIFGYPPNLPSDGPPSLHGAIHNTASLAVFVVVPIVCFVMAWRFARDPAWRSWAGFSAICGVLIFGFLAWFFASVTAAMHGHGGAPPGLLERILSVIGCVWISGLALRFTFVDVDGGP